MSVHPLWIGKSFEEKKQEKEQTELDCTIGRRSEEEFTVWTPRSSRLCDRVDLKESMMGIMERLTILPVCGESMTSTTVSPVFPSYTNIFESDPTLTK